MIAVADDGEGIPPELEARLFTRFMHQGTTIVVPGGVGLGLSIVKHLVQSLHGTIELESESGRGSTFRVQLDAA